MEERKSWTRVGAVFHPVPLHPRIARSVPNKNSGGAAMSDAPIYRQFRAVTFEQIEFLGSHWNSVYSEREDYRLGYTAYGSDCSVRVTGTHGSRLDVETIQVPKGELVVVDGNTATIPVFETPGKE